MCVEEVILGDRVKELFSGSTARFDIATARGESSTERNYRWARRAFSSGGHLPPPPLRGSWAAAIEPLHGKAFCLMRVKKGKESKRKTRERVPFRSHGRAYPLHDWELIVSADLLLHIFHGSARKESAFTLRALFLTFPVDSRLQVRMLVLLYVTDILPTRPWPCSKDRTLFATCGLWCQRDHVWLSPHPVQQSEQRGSVTRLSASL